MVKCNLCSLSFSHNQALNEHMLNLHSVECPFGCEVCGKHFKRKCNLAQHKLVHGGTRCRYCKVMFRNLQDHHRAPCCQAAIDVIGNREAVVEDPLVDADVAFTTCTKCEKRLKKTSLRAHMINVHPEDPTPFKCNKCGSIFSQEKNLRCHDRIHHKQWDGKPTCSYRTCRKVFKTSDELHRHVKNDHLPLSCVVCGHSVATKTDLKQHMKVHEEIDYVCPLCSTITQSKPKLRKHLHNRHKLRGEEATSALRRARKIRRADGVELSANAPNPVAPPPNAPPLRQSRWLKNEEPQEEVVVKDDVVNPIVEVDEMADELDEEIVDDVHMEEVNQIEEPPELIQEDDEMAEVPPVQKDDEVLEEDALNLSEESVDAVPRISSTISKQMKRMNESKDNIAEPSTSNAAKRVRLDEEDGGKENQEKQAKESVRPIVEPPSNPEPQPKKECAADGCTLTGESLRFGSLNVYCQKNCRIPPGSDYMESTSFPGNFKHYYCIACWNDCRTKPDFDEEGHRLTINQGGLEPSIPCSNCGDVWHKICALHVSKGEFQCRKCSDVQQEVTVDFVPRNPIDLKLQNAGNKIIEGLGEDQIVEGQEEPRNQISVISFIVPKNIPVCQVVPKKFRQDFSEVFQDATGTKEQKKGLVMSYNRRAIYIWQRIDGIDVPFMAMYTQEYEKQQMCILDYLDSVRFTKPGDIKGKLCRAMVIGYFTHMRDIGFQKLHFWAKPPVKDDIYVFNIHDKDQDYPTQQKLENWYHGILTDAVKLGIVTRFNDFDEELRLKKFARPSEMPVFFESIWSYEMRWAVEELLEIEKETKEAYQKRFMDHLMTNVFPKHLNDNLYADLAPSNDLIPEEERKHHIMDSRDKFIHACQQNCLEFSSLRRIKFSAVFIIQRFLNNIRRQD